MLLSLKDTSLSKILGFYLNHLNSKYMLYLCEYILYIYVLYICKETGRKTNQKNLISPVQQKPGLTGL